MTVTFLKPGCEPSMQLNEINVDELISASNFNVNRTRTLFYKEHPIVHLTCDDRASKDSVLSGVVSAELLRHSEILTCDKLTVEFKNLYCNTIRNVDIYMDEVSAIITLIRLLDRLYTQPILIIDLYSFRDCSQRIKDSISNIGKSLSTSNSLLCTAYYLGSNTTIKNQRDNFAKIHTEL